MDIKGVLEIKLWSGIKLWLYNYGESVKILCIFIVLITIIITGVQSIIFNVSIDESVLQSCESLLDEINGKFKHLESGYAANQWISKECWK